MNVVDAVRLDVAPVAVIVFEPPVVSATVIAVVIVQDPRLVVLVQVKGDAVNAVVATETDSLAPNPDRVNVFDPDSTCCGKPKLFEPVATVKLIFGVTVNAVLTEFVPSVTTMV